MVGLDNDMSMVRQNIWKISHTNSYLCVTENIFSRLGCNKMLNIGCSSEPSTENTLSCTLAPPHRKETSGCNKETCNNQQTQTERSIIPVSHPPKAIIKQSSMSHHQSLSMCGYVLPQPGR
jgi:hypothetical protein